MIAVIIVAVKLIFEHQQDLDRAAEIEDEPSAYTFSGILKRMREDRKAMREEKKAKRRAARMAARGQAQETRIPSISVRGFEEQQEQ